MGWIEFSDIIGIVIVIYVYVMAHNNHHMRKDIKYGFLYSGMALFMLYCFDMSWYVMYYKCPVSPRTDFLLNFVTCMVYLMLPISMISFSALYTNLKRRPRHYIGLVSIILLAIIDIANIFIPLIFYYKHSVLVSW